MPTPSDVVERLRAAGCVFAEDEAALLSAAAAGHALDALVRRRVAGEPLEHVLGWVDFGGVRLAVGPGVFVPRQRTMLMADIAVDLARASGPRPLVVELCCGVAPVAAVVAARVPHAEVWAADVDPVAVGYAGRNLAGRGTVLVGDLDRPLPAALRGRVVVLAVNTPYVPTAAIPGMPPEARDHEPAAALDGGPDGLDVQRRLAVVAAGWLAAAGEVLVETSRGQAPTAVALLAAAGLRAVVEQDDERDATVVRARL